MAIRITDIPIGIGDRGYWKWEVGMRKWEVGIRKWEVGPVVVPEGRDYAVAKDAAFDKLRRDKVGKIAKRREHSA